MTAWIGRASLDTAAPLGAAAPIDQHRDAALAPVADPAVEARAAIGPHATLDLMPNRSVLALHPNKFVTVPQFVPAETTHYICRS